MKCKKCQRSLDGHISVWSAGIVSATLMADCPECGTRHRWVADYNFSLLRIKEKGLMWKLWKERR